jgi:hypothetical protein
MHNKSLSLIALLFLLALLSTTVFLHPGDLFSNAPVFDDDYAMHFSQCLSTQRFFERFGKTWGYDPFLMAGFPRGVLVNADNKGWELFYYLLEPLLGRGLAFKLYPLLFLLLYPLFIYGAARNFGCSRAVSLTAACTAVLFFHLSLSIDLFYSGMVSYILVSFFSFYVLSQFYLLLYKRFSLVRYVIVLILGTLLLLCHLLSPIHLITPIAIMYLLQAKKLSLRQHLLIAAIPVVILLANGYWLLLIVKFYHYKTVRPENWEFSLQIKDLLEPFKVYLMQRKTYVYKLEVLNNTFLDAILLVFGVGGLTLWYRRGQRTLVLAFSGGFTVLFFIAFYGSHISFLSQFQPERFLIPLSLLLLFPASLALYLSLQTLFAQRTRVAQCFIIAVLAVLLFRPVIKPFGIMIKHQVYRLNCTFPKELMVLLQFLEQQTTRAGRILIEDSEWSYSDPAHRYYGGHFPALFGEYLQRHYLCGPRPMYPMKHSYASFTDGILFEKEIRTFTLEQLKYYFDHYNVKWILCWKKETIEHLSQFPEYIKEIKIIDNFKIYVVKRRPTFFLKGTGDVRADYNRIELKNITAPEQEIILSFHWMEYLITEPPMTIEPVFLADDPVGFIKVRNPAESFVIYNAY